MARIESFVETPVGQPKVHGPVECGYRSFSHGGERYLVLETYGSPDRKLAGKTSQSIQLDRDAAAALVRIIEQAFPGIGREV